MKRSNDSRRKSKSGRFILRSKAKLKKLNNSTVAEIIPPSLHKIEVTQMSSNAVQACLKLQSKGYEACIVGGGVRDALLGRHPKDFDIATNALPRQICSVFGYKNARVIGKRFRIVHLNYGGELIEVTTFRGRRDDPEMKYSPLTRDNNFSSSQSDDATRRDFTINAFYYDPKTRNVFDYYEGWKDIQKRKLRMIGNPKSRFIEDPVRILRALRISQKLGLDLGKKNLGYMRKLSHLLSEIPSARINEEIKKILFSGNSLGCFKMINDLGIKLQLLSLSEQNADLDFIHAIFEYFDTERDSGLDLSFFITASLWHFYERGRRSLKLEELLGRLKSIFRSYHLPMFMLDNVFSALRFQWQLSHPSKTALVSISKDFFGLALHLFRLRSLLSQVPRELVEWWERVVPLDPECRLIELENYKKRWT